MHIHKVSAIQIIVIVCVKFSYCDAFFLFLRTFLLLHLVHTCRPTLQRVPQHSPDSAVTGPVEISPIPMRTTASTGGSKPRLYCHISTHTLCICVGDAIMPARYEYNRFIVSIVFVLDMYPGVSL
jgi:hypothetical protein